MTTREEQLKKVAREFYDTKATERAWSKDSDALRSEFFRLHDEQFKGKGYLLPVKTIEVPDEFWHSTQMSKEDFVSSRFPGWDVEHCEYNTALGKTVFVLKRNPQYIPGMVELPEEDLPGEEGDYLIRVSKEISEYTPEIDWETLRQERPDIWDKIAQPITSYEIDEEGFEKLVEETPEELATIQRHMKVRKPVLRATAKRVKANE